METFLNAAVNSALRREDMRKIQTFGPYCFLLLNSLWTLRQTGMYRGSVIRGGLFKLESIEQYKPVVGLDFHRQRRPK